MREHVKRQHDQKRVGDSVSDTSADHVHDDSDEDVPPSHDLRPDIPHSARLYDYYLGRCFIYR